MSRVATRSRQTGETSVNITVNVDGTGLTNVSTGVPFFDHMLNQLGKHGAIDLNVEVQGDIEVDTHHTVEDTGIALGECLRQALGDKAGVRRFASVSVPLDEALIDVAIDLSGRPFLVHEADVPTGAPLIGTPGFEPQLAEEFWRAFVMASHITMHLTKVRGKNTHHIVEASFKGVARALRDAVRIESDQMPSTKGTLNA